MAMNQENAYNVKGVNREFTQKARLLRCLVEKGGDRDARGLVRNSKSIRAQIAPCSWRDLRNLRKE